ncbi:hypothetical protein [Aliamphritea spongicola]|nr:hypothetical protein [Aliamphritea spongicola]
MQAAEAAREQGYEVSVLAVGTAEGATLQTASGQVISDAEGSAYVSRLPLDGLEKLARQGGGSMAVITAGGEDLAQLLPQDSGAVLAGESSDIRSDSWVDSGYWLLLLPVLAVPLLFRRGLVFGLVCMLGVAGFQPDSAMASEEAAVKASEKIVENGAVSSAFETASGWKGLWKTPDQQGSEALPLLISVPQHRPSSRRTGRRPPYTAPVIIRPLQKNMLNCNPGIKITTWVILWPAAATFRARWMPMTDS